MVGVDGSRTSLPTPPGWRAASTAVCWRCTWAGEFRSVRGDPLAELTRIAEQAHADAVVVGASEHLGHRIVGSLAARLVQAGKWPVIVVP
jgi:nucleotide-binding universal stress UspA family protein